MALETEARALLEEHFNCTQSVLAPFVDRFGLDRAIALKIATPFGGGIGHTGHMCGAVSGALMVIGLVQGTAVFDRAQKYVCFDFVAQFMARFKARHGVLTCPGLLGVDISNPTELEQARHLGLFHTRCPNFVVDAVLIVADLLGLEP